MIVVISATLSPGPITVIVACGYSGERLLL